MTTARKTRTRRTSAEAQPRAKPRRTQAQRRQETTDKILRAAIELLVDRGYSGFSTIAVATHAKVSRGARENYFKTKYDLIEAAWKAALHRAEMRSRRKAGQTSPDPLGDFLASSRSFYLSGDYIALLELAMAARTDRKIRRIMHVLFKENRKRHDQLWLEAFEGAGYARKDVARFIDLANCVFRGAAMLSAWGLPPSLYRPAIAELRGLAPTPEKHRSSPRKRGPRVKQAGFPLARE
jgi:AcrR family transcriptional regulator